MQIKLQGFFIKTFLMIVLYLVFIIIIYELVTLKIRLNTISNYLKTFSIILFIFK